MRKSILFLLYFLFATLLVVNIWVFASGRTYLYKAIQTTYFKGKSGPSIDEYAIFESRIVKAENPKPWNFSDDFNTKTIPAEIEKKMIEMETVSFLVIQNDSIKFEKYYKDWNTESISNSFSMAKTILSVLTGIAIKEGKIKDVNQKVSDFIPEFRNDERKNVSIKDLLTMSSGIGFFEDYVNPLAYPAEAYYGNDLKKLTLAYPQEVEPGTRFSYLSGDSQLLAFVLEAATGKKVSDYASEKLWSKINAESDALWNLDDKDGNEKAFCCFISKARDFARIGKLYQQKGNWSGEQIVDTNYVNESIEPCLIKDTEGNICDYYGYKWWLNDYKGFKIFYMRGIKGQYVINIPEKNIIIVRLGYKRPAEKHNNAPEDFYWAIDAALSMY